jgi:putative ATPase
MKRPPDGGLFCSLAYIFFMPPKKKPVSQKSLFAEKRNVPLAEQLRPQTLGEIIGQEHLTGEEGVLRRMVEAKHLQSIILWGPPGCGKTTIARLLADEAGYVLEQVSAVASGVNDLKKHFEVARERQMVGQRTVLFIDEVHRFNRAQQDVLLPVVEDGTITLIGATTENPSFELNSALLSRSRVLVLNRLTPEALQKLIARAEALLGKTLPLDIAARETLLAMADGDGRYLLSMVEAIFDAGPKEALTPETLGKLLQQRPPVYDKAQESHYNLISALHKSLRGSDVQAALYWFARMLDGGEDPLYIARRLIRFASEDIGMADPQALVQAIAARQAYEMLGSPEGELMIAQSVIYLATAPKSNAQYTAFGAAKRAAKTHGSLMPPKHILNAPTKLMQELGYGKDYDYDHNAEDGFSGQNYFPDEMPREEYYTPVERGFEREISKRLEYWEKLRAKRNQP